MQDFGGDLDALLESLDEEQRAAFRPEPVILRPGEASIHHSHLIHGSCANHSDRPRRGVVLNTIADDSASLLRGVPIIPRGEPLAGPFFPIVLDRGAGESSSLSLRLSLPIRNLNT